MKNTFLYFFVFLFSSSFVFAQNKGQIVYDAYSGRTAVANPSNENGYPFEYEIETGVLYFHNATSLYQQKQNEMTTMIRTSSDGVTKTQVPRNNRDEIGWVYLTDLNSSEIYSREAYWNFSKFESIEEPRTKIQWTITSDSKEIAGYKCTKAIAQISGRQWEAWFTEAIPVSFGPWKLRGLPGLILEAHNKNLDFIYKLREVKIPGDFPNSTIGKSYFQTDMMTKSEFIKKDQKKRDKYLSYMESVAVENDGSVDIKFYPSREIQHKKNDE